MKHSRCPDVVHLFARSPRRTISVLSRNQQTATSLRPPHSFLEPENSPQENFLDGIEADSSIRSTQKHVANGSYEEAQIQQHPRLCGNSGLLREVPGNNTSQHTKYNAPISSASLRIARGSARIVEPDRLSFLQSARPRVRVTPPPSLPRHLHSATLSLRYSHSVAESENVERGHPIDIIEGEQAIRKFRQCLEDGDHDEARGILFDLVQHHELGSNFQLFRELLDIISSSGADAVGLLLVDFGVLLARKGHFRFVAEEIKPLLTGDVALSSLDQALDSIGTAPPAPGVFEDSSEDYVLPPAAESSPSTLDLIEATLPLTLPASRPGNSMFEARGRDYLAVEKSGGVDAGQRNTRVIEQAIASNAYDEALERLKEIQSLGSPIAMSAAFAEPAARALEDGRTQDFFTWLAHVPPHHEGDYSAPFTRIQNMLSQRLTLDRPLFMRVVMSLAGKGYQHIVLRCLQDIFRETRTLSGLETIIRDVEQCAFEYYLTEDASTAQTRRRKVASFLRAAAVRVCAWQYRFEDALALLPSQNDAMFLPPLTYQVLLKKLGRGKAPQHVVDEVKYREACDFAKMKEYYGDEYVAAHAQAARAHPASDIDSSSVDPTDIDASIDFLHDAIQYNHQAMTQRFVADFITSYVDRGRPLPGALKDLAHHAADRSYGAMFQWTLGEMEYYRRRNQPELIILTFVEHFQLKGVPADRVMEIYNKAKVEADDDGTRVEPARRVTGYDPRLARMSRSWLGAKHRTFVWEVLVKNTQELKETRELYNQLVDILSEYRAQHSEAAVRLQPLVDAEVFMPFFRRVNHGARTVDQIIGDMLHFGVKPTSYVWTTALFVWARTGNRDRVVHLFRAFDRQYGPTSARSEQDTSFSSDDFQGSASSWDFNKLDLPPPTVDLYVSAIRGFIERGSNVGAMVTVNYLWRVIAVKSPEDILKVRKAPGNEDLDRWLNVLEDRLRQDPERAAVTLRMAKKLMPKDV